MQTCSDPQADFPPSGFRSNDRAAASQSWKIEVQAYTDAAANLVTRDSRSGAEDAEPRLQCDGPHQRGRSRKTGTASRLSSVSNVTQLRPPKDILLSYDVDHGHAGSSVGQCFRGVA